MTRLWSHSLLGALRTTACVCFRTTSEHILARPKSAFRYAHTFRRTLVTVVPSCHQASLRTRAMHMMSMFSCFVTDGITEYAWHGGGIGAFRNSMRRPSAASTDGMQRAMAAVTVGSRVAQSASIWYTSPMRWIYCHCSAMLKAVPRPSFQASIRSGSTRVSLSTLGYGKVGRDGAYVPHLRLLGVPTLTLTTAVLK